MDADQGSQKPSILRQGHLKSYNQRLLDVEMAYYKVCDQIDALKTSGSHVAPAGCWVVRYLAKGKTGDCWYYKLQAKQPLFKNRNGKPCRYQHLGKAGSDDYLEAIASVGRRAHLEALEYQKKLLEQGLNDLASESQSEPLL